MSANLVTVARILREARKQSKPVERMRMLRRSAEAVQADPSYTKADLWAVYNAILNEVDELLAVPGQTPSKAAQIAGAVTGAAVKATARVALAALVGGGDDDPPVARTLMIDSDSADFKAYRAELEKAAAASAAVRATFPSVDLVLLDEIRSIYRGSGSPSAATQHLAAIVSKNLAALLSCTDQEFEAIAG